MSSRAEKFVLITHGGTIKMILSIGLRLPLSRLWSFRIDSGSLSIVNFYPRYAEVVRWNDTTHLEALGK